MSCMSGGMERLSGRSSTDGRQRSGALGGDDRDDGTLHRTIAESSTRNPFRSILRGFVHRVVGGSLYKALEAGATLRAFPAARANRFDRVLI